MRILTKKQSYFIDKISIENYKNNIDLYDSFLNDSLKSDKSIDSVKLNTKVKLFYPTPLHFILFPYKFLPFTT